LTKNQFYAIKFSKIFVCLTFFDYLCRRNSFKIEFILVFIIVSFKKVSL